MIQIWYYQHGQSRDLGMGYDWCKEHNCLPDPDNLLRTHTHLKDIPDCSLDEVFYQMQGEVWSSDGENVIGGPIQQAAQALIRSKGLTHTSMSVGDIAIKDGKVYFCDSFGWKELRQ